MVRSRNEDSYGATGLIASRADGEIVAATVTRLPFLAVVADGLGGHASGDLASAVAVEHVLATNPRSAAALVSAVHGANRAIVELMSREPASRGMGTTIAAVLVHSEGLAVVNVGDSPVLELLGERLVQLTKDDVMSRGDFGGMRPSALTQSLGGGRGIRDITPHLYEDRVIEHRRILLTSDGLTSFVPRHVIVNALDHDDPELAVDALLSVALEAGGADNVTCLLVDIA